MKKLVSILLALIFLTQSMPVNALAEALYPAPTAQELTAAVALTGLDDSAPGYRSVTSSVSVRLPGSRTHANTCRQLPHMTTLSLIPFSFASSAPSFASLSSLVMISAATIFMDALA